MDSIYTPCKPNENHLKEKYSIGDVLTVKEIARNRTIKCIVSSFPTNSNSDLETDHRMELKPVDNGFYGRIVISLGNNFYGNLHISQVEILK